MTGVSIVALACVVFLSAGASIAQTANDSFDALRGDTPINDEGTPPPIAAPQNTSEQEVRNYPEQPPLIPHSIEGYQIDANSNKCLSCHARSRTRESGAPMLSVTHFMDRSEQILASVSPRRYFCTQCHVPQYQVKPPVDNNFVDVDALLHPAPPGAKR
jgi:cytochrome c-type protein NapB